MKASAITLNDLLLVEFCLFLPSPVQGSALDKGMLISSIFPSIPVHPLVSTCLVLHTIVQAGLEKLDCRTANAMQQNESLHLYLAL